MARWDHRTAILTLKESISTGQAKGVPSGLDETSRNTLMELGAQGWEMVSVLPFFTTEKSDIMNYNKLAPKSQKVIAFFKRQVMEVKHSSVMDLGRDVLAGRLSVENEKPLSDKEMQEKIALRDALLKKNIMLIKEGSIKVGRHIQDKKKDEAVDKAKTLLDFIKKNFSDEERNIPNVAAAEHTFKKVINKYSK